MRGRDKNRGSRMMQRTTPVMLLAMVMALLVVIHVVRAGFTNPVSAPLPLNTNAMSDVGQDRVPRIAAGANGRWIAVWESNENLNGTIGTDYDIFYAISNDHGGTWSSPVALHSNAGSDGANNDTAPSISTDGNGVWIAVWEGRAPLNGAGGTDIDLFFSRSIDDGNTWSPVAALNANATSDDGTDLDPHLLHDGASTWIAYWRSTATLVGTIGSDADILIARSLDDGATWSVPVPLNTNASSDAGATDTYARVVTDGSGNWVAVWQSNNTLGGTIGSDYDILVSSSADNAQSWSPPVALNSNAVGPNAEDAEPVIATDGQGMWICVWSSLDSLGGTIGTDRDILYSRSNNNGATWSSAAPLHSNAATDVGEDRSPSIATDGSGHWSVVWHSTENLGGSIGTDADLLISHSDDAGQTWSAPIAFNSNAAADSGEDQFVTVACDSSGAWCAVWQSNDSLNGTIGTDLDVLHARFAIPDCNLNTIPDDAEVDCNGNDVPDDCDIASGISIDANRDGIPDECDLPPPTCPADLAPVGNLDNTVGVPDLLFIINNWGPCANPRNCPADIAPLPDGDDTVGVPDLLYIINNWGRCP